MVQKALALVMTPVEKAEGVAEAAEAAEAAEKDMVCKKCYINLKCL